MRRQQLKLLLTTDVVGGVWDFTCTLAAEWVAVGHAVRLFALGGTPSPNQQAQAAQTGALLTSAPFKVEWMQDAEVDVARGQQALQDLVATWQPDVLHASQFASALVESHGAPVVLTLHSDVLSWRTWSLNGGNTELVPTEWLTYRRLVEQALHAADRLVAVSGFLAAETRRHYALPPGRRLDVIHNGWPSDPQPAPPASERGRSTLLAGRFWDQGKNVGLAAGASPRLRAPGPIWLAGESRHPDGGQAELPASLQPLGFLPRQALEAVLRASRVYLSPARYDPFGLLPLQAALAGCALLLADIPSYREVWADAARYFNPHDTGALTAAWQRVLDDDHLADSLASQARARAEARYSPRRMAEAYARVYRQPGMPGSRVLGAA